ncbi:hypothetical protein [Erythrobacter sp. AP23]|uniref:hypothetical protein n=1 Tax=Erythrobacter sp. AP23 TaxID=499656 RepID=UPI00076C5123|nr:hypothetical protein [Erythrobacter sp. AP23]KWV93763.1 hypothetical protein ASS64_12775 [Erythrobacter sp. AP23]
MTKQVESQPKRVIGMLFQRLRPSKLFACAVAVMIAAFAPSSPSFGQAESQTQEPAVATATETDMVFVSAENLAVSAVTTDDLFAAGGTVVTSGAQADHLFLAGGEIEVIDATVHDLIAWGGELRLRSAQVTDDIIVGGGDIVARPGFDIGGSAVLAGGSVRLEAPVGGDLRIGAGDIFVNSSVQGTARLSGDTIVLGPLARIGGDLLYRSENLTIQPGAVIEGRRAALPMPDRSTAEEIGKGVGQLFLLFGLSIVLSYFILVALLVFFAPGLMRSASTMMREKPWQSFGIGVLYALIVPLLVVALVVTVVAAPLAVLLIAISVALTPIALAVTAYFVGMSLRRVTTGTSDPPDTLFARIIWPLLGVIAVFLLTLIPVAGALIWLLAMVFGLGALAKQAAGALTAPAMSPSA